MKKYFCILVNHSLNDNYCIFGQSSDLNIENKVKNDCSEDKNEYIVSSEFKDIIAFYIQNIKKPKFHSNDSTYKFDEDFKSKILEIWDQYKDLL